MKRKVSSKKLKAVLIPISCMVLISIIAGASVAIGLNYGIISERMRELTWAFLTPIIVSLFSFLNIVFGMFVKFMQTRIINKNQRLNRLRMFLLFEYERIIKDNSLSPENKLKQLEKVVSRMKEVESNV